jgi:hypothetical protein
LLVISSFATPPLCIKASMIIHIKLFIDPPLVTCSKDIKIRNQIQSYKT